MPQCIYVKNTYSITSETLSSDFEKNTFLESNKIEIGKAGLSDPVIVDNTIKKWKTVSHVVTYLKSTPKYCSLRVQSLSLPLPDQLLLPPPNSNAQTITSLQQMLSTVEDQCKDKEASVKVLELHAL